MKCAELLFKRQFKKFRLCNVWMYGPRATLVLSVKFLIGAVGCTSFFHLIVGMFVSIFLSQIFVTDLDYA